MIKRIFVAACVVLLGGCAQQPVQQPLLPEQPITPGQADARTRADIHTQRGAAYFEVGSLGVALEALNEAVNADPNFGPAYNVLGLVYMDLREDDLAQKNFLRALQLNPVDSDANNNYGWFLCQRKRYQEAIKFFLAALRNPLYATPDKSYVNAGICSRRQGDEAGAAEFFERALKLDPNQPQALFQLAEMAYQRGALAEARSRLMRLVRSGVQPTAEMLWLAVRVERKLGDRDAEASYGLQLRRNFPESREAQALLNRQFE